MATQKFKARFGWDANGQTGLGLADPPLNAAGTDYEPLSAVNWETLRAHTGLRIVADEAARLALEGLSGELIVGDVVVEQLSGLSWRYTAPNTWVPYASGGLTYVGRQGLLPNPATTVLTDGQLFVIKTDFGGEELYRLVSWDESIPARNAQDPVNIGVSYTNAQPTLGVPTIAEIELSGITGVTAGSGDVLMRISTATTPSHTYTYTFQPGETLNQIAAGIAALYDQAGTHDPDTIAQSRGSTIVISGNPGAPALPPRPVQGQRFDGTALTDATLAQFINSANRQAGDYIINDGTTPLTTPNGDTVPPDTAVIVESRIPLSYWVGDGPTPVTPAQTVTQQGTLMQIVTSQQELTQWLTFHTTANSAGDYALNPGPGVINSGGYTLGAGMALVMTPTGPVMAASPTPPSPQMTGGLVLAPTIRMPNAITDQDALDRLNDPLLTDGWWFEWTGATKFTPSTYPGQANGMAQALDPGDWAIYRNSTDKWVGIAGGGSYPPGTPGNIGGTIVPGQWTPPPVPPTADFMMPAQAPAVPVVATAPATQQVDPTEFNTVVAVVGNFGPVVTPPAGGWRYLNRRIWDKDLRQDPDQLTDQRPDDLQITRERDHEEIKAWNDPSGQWDTIYSRDAINAAIAALSLFEGTADEVGGGAIGAVEFDQLPDLAAMSAANDLSLTSHYWTYIGSPNYVVTSATPNIGVDLDGAILNPGDWIQISNHGGDGSGVGANGGAPDLQWVTIGGDLLAKARADRLFGLQPWTAGGWEQGSLVVYQGDVYRATRPVTGQDGDPLPQGGGVQIPLVGTPDLLTVTGGALDTLTTQPATGTGSVVTASGANVFPGGPFTNAAYTNGDSWVYSDSPYLSGTGTTADGYRYDSGWVAIGQTSPIPDPFVVTMPAGASPWAVVDISGGLKVAADMAGLPMTAPPGQVWIVLAGAGAKQELYSYDGGAQQWQELGGGGTPMDLSGGLVVYPRTLFIDGQPPADLAVAPTPQPKVVGDTLWSRTSYAHPVCLAMSTDGSTWNRHNPQRLIGSITGAGRPGVADYPTQLCVGMAGGNAKITHIANDARGWVPVAEPVIPPSVGASQRSVFSATKTSFEGVYEGCEVNYMGVSRTNQMVPRLAIGGSQMQGRSLNIFYNYHHIVYGAGTYDYQMLGTTNFNRSDGSIWFTEVPIVWDESVNRVQNDKPFTINVKAFKYGSTFSWQTRIVYNRSGDGSSVETMVLGKIYGGNANAISLVGPRFSEIVDGVRFSHLNPTW